MTFGDLELQPVSDGFFRLDGGAMFGVVPRVLWERQAPPDGRHRIRLALRALLVRGVRTLLVDAGVGDVLDARGEDIYGLEPDRRLDGALAEAGVTPGEIDIVLATHLHFDHAGGFTVSDATGTRRPRFDRAQYVARRGEWEAACEPNERTRGSYLPGAFAPLAASGALQLVDHDATIMPGVTVRRTGGHTRDHQIVMIESRGRTAVFVADLIPTAAHLSLPWIMGFDLYPLETLAFKRTLIREAIEREYLVFFQHDPEIVAGVIRERNDRPYVERVL